MTQLRYLAIQTALKGNWDQAITLNKSLLKDDPNDIETLNRLGFALSALGKIKSAKDIYQKVLKLDAHNPIAIRNLKRLLEVKKNNKSLIYKKNNLKATILNGQTPTENGSFLNNIFLEETGKTKVIELVNVATPRILSLLQTGETLTLSTKRLKVFVLDRNNQYIGVLPDNIGKRMIDFLKGGNSYESYVRAVKNNKVTIFVKETKRAKRFKNQPSFLMLKSKSNSIGGLSKKSLRLQKIQANETEEESYPLSSGFSEIAEEEF